MQNASEILEYAYKYLYRYYLRELTSFINGDAPEEYGVFLESLAKRFNFRKTEGDFDLERAEAKFLSIL